MKYIKDYHDGDRVSGVYLCKQKTSAVTKNGKPYDNVIIQDKTGTMDCKIWDVGSQGIDDFDALDYIDVVGDVTSFNGQLQISIKRVRVAGEGEYDPSDYLPMTKKNIDEMWQQLLSLIDSVENPYLNKLLCSFFKDDADFIKRFRFSSAAKSVHHAFVGGLVEHTLSVASLCNFYCTRYPMLKRDLLITAAICHDMGKICEYSAFPMNDYTDEGQLLGHIVMGVEMIGDRIREIPSFPKTLERELKHCIVAHHGELEYGSPKKPALIEATALYFADNTDAKMETFTEAFEASNSMDWLGYNKFLESNIRITKMD